MRTNRVPLRFAPRCLVKSHPLAERSHARSPGHPVVGFPTVCVFQYLLGENRVHQSIVRSAKCPVDGGRSAYEEEAEDEAMEQLVINLANQSGTEDMAEQHGYEGDARELQRSAG